MMMNVFRHFFCWWPQSSDRLWASSSSFEDEFPIHGILKEAHTPGRGKHWESDGENSLSHYTNPQVKLNGDGEALQGSIRMVQTICEADPSLASPPKEDSGGSHVACSPRGFSETLSFDWLRLRLCLWIVRPQKAELIFKWKLIQCYILYTGFLKGFCLKKKKEKKKVRLVFGWNYWVLMGFIHALEEEGVKRSISEVAVL